MGKATHIGSFAVKTAFIRGTEAVPVMVEVSCSSGLPHFLLVGMADSTVHEARYRVAEAISSCGFDSPRMNVTVNLQPAELRKTGTGFDLPIAVGILAASGQIPTQGLDECLFVGELGLSGEVCPVRGDMAYAILASQQGLKLISSVDAPPRGGVDCESGALASLGRLRYGVNDLPAHRRARASDGIIGGGAEDALDFRDVCDQEVAKRAMVVAAAGRHGIMMVGPPGAGKTMLARRLTTILPRLDERDRVDAMLMHSVVGLPCDGIERGEPPFRAPHHSVSMAGLLGGGRPVAPGEVSLAHKGVLFLDELPEFANNVLQSLRQPIEDKEVRIVRVEGRYSFPCDFMLVAAANPCPCGHLGDQGHPCTCAPALVERYQARMGGPLANRIDMHIDVARPESSKVIEGGSGMSSQDMRDAVLSAREFAAHRGPREDSYAGVRFAQMLDADARDAFERIARRLCMGGRSIDRTLRVARTIADIEHHDLVTTDDVMEACMYRGRANG